MLKWTYLLFYNNYRVASLFKMYLTFKGAISENLTR